MRNGRPLRFLAIVLGGWIAARVAILWPGEGPPVLALPALPGQSIGAEIKTPPSPGERPAGSASPVVIPLAWRNAHDGNSGRRRTKTGRATPEIIDWALQGAPGSDGPVLQNRASPPLVASLPSATHHPSRWSASIWLVARRGTGSGQGFAGPQLGGSQAGIRIAYDLDRRHRLAVAARIASPLGAGQRDAAIGIAWQPTRWPVRLVAEQRFTLGPGRGGPTIGAIGGFGPARIGHGVRLEGYGQAGYIARHDGEAFADGALRVSHPLVSLGRIEFDLGAATWGAVQKGAARIDAGPSLGLVLPVAHHPIRLALEWRERVAGNAAPASGPALTIGADF